MRSALVTGIVAVLTAASAAQPPTALKVILLGTAGGPTMNRERLGISTLVVAGSEPLLFDAGRGLTFALARLAHP